MSQPIAPRLSESGADARPHRLGSGLAHLAALARQMGLGADRRAHLPSGGWRTVRFVSDSELAQLRAEFERRRAARGSRRLQADGSAATKLERAVQSLRGLLSDPLEERPAAVLWEREMTSRGLSVDTPMPAVKVVRGDRRELLDELAIRRLDGGAHEMRLGHGVAPRRSA